MERNMTSIVLINGEKQVGKSTFAEHLANLLFENGITSQRYSFVAPVEAAVYAFMEQSRDDVMVEFTPYEELKNMQLVPGIAGPTGRDLMIMLGNAARNLHPYMLQQIFLNQAIADKETQVWIIENWGFPNELHFFRERSVQAALPGATFTIALTERASRKYASDEQFDNDNRFNLETLADWVNPTVNQMAKIIDPAHDYPIDTIWQQFHSEVEPLGDIENLITDATT